MNGLRVGYVPQHFAPEHTMPISVKRFLGLRRNVDKKQLDKVTEETGNLKIGSASFRLFLEESDNVFFWLEAF